MGVWKNVEDCVPFTDVSCGSTEIVVDQDRYTTYSFKSDGNYDVSSTGEMKYHFTYPASCLQSFHSCDQLSGTSGRLTTSCAGDASVSCTCNATLTGDFHASGTYVADSATSVAMTATGESNAQTLSYCVSGATLTINGQALPSPILLERVQ